MEERIKDPKEFAKQLPLLDCFYKEFVFPTIRAAVAQNGKTLEHFQESMDSIPLRNGKNLETGKRLLDILVDINDGDKKKQSLRDKAEHLKRILDKEPCRYSNTPEGKPSFSKWKTASDELKNHETACQAYLEKSESFVSNLMKYIHRKSKYVEMKDEQDFKLLLLSKTLEPPSPKDEPAYEEYKEKCEKRAHRPDLKKKAWSRRDYKDLMLPQKPETTR